MVESSRVKWNQIYPWYSVVVLSTAMVESGKVEPSRAMLGYSTIKWSHGGSL